MIEVEKKFVLSSETAVRAAASAKFVGEETIEDVYYDTADCKLIREDIWLRARNGNFELKIFRAGNGVRVIDTYEEIEIPEKVRAYLGLPEGQSLEDTLKNNGYAPFCVCKTTRKNYKCDDFNIVLDDAVFNDGFVWKIGEIEIMVNEKSEMEKAKERIDEFARAHGLSETPEHGKIVEYLKVKRPTYFKAFVNRKTISTS